MEEILYRYNPWWEQKDRFADGVKQASIGIERPSLLTALEKNVSSRQIVFLTGLRRVGKTTLFKLFIKRLVETHHIAPRLIFYVSVDDYLLAKHSIIELVEEYRKIQKVLAGEEAYLFFDEVTYNEDFEIQLKNLHDREQTHIFASSSSDSVLKSKKPYLTGRSVVVEVLPLDFNEYLAFKNITISKADRRVRERYFDEYLSVGGMPEYVLTGNPEYLKELVDDIIYKDIVALYNIRNPSAVKDFFLLLMERAGKLASINKLARIAGISPDTAKRYLSFFSDTYLIYLVARYGKTNERILSPKKVYAADLGIRTLFTGFRDKGSLFENYVYLHLKDKNPRYVYEGGAEIDFITTDGTLIEVKYGSDMTDAQRMLFERFPSNQKVVVRSIDDVAALPML